MNNNALTRGEVYNILSAERDYQNFKWQNLDEMNTTGDFLIYMQRSLNKAMDAHSGIPNDPDTLRYISHVAAIAVATMEKYGAPRRAGF